MRKHIDTHALENKATEAHRYALENKATTRLRLHACEAIVLVVLKHGEVWFADVVHAAEAVAGHPDHHVPDPRESGHKMSGIHAPISVQ